MKDTRLAIQKALAGFAADDLKTGAVTLFNCLGYASAKTISLDGTFEAFADRFKPAESLRTNTDAKISEWRQVQFVFQLTDDELPVLAAGAPTIHLLPETFRSTMIESFVFLAIDLEPREWTRAELAGIMRAVNRIFPMPVIILFRSGNLVSLAIVDRRVNKRDQSRDVIEKRISIIKDVNCSQPHRAHLDILASLDFANLKKRGRALETMVDLHDAWLTKLSVKELNKRFYNELANWFYWAASCVTFPTADAVKTDTKEVEKQNQIALIRLLTRLIFVWFIKERKLVPDELFEEGGLNQLLTDDPALTPENDNYYKAILQNLFFATLNAEDPAKRDWRKKASGGNVDGHYLVHTTYRYEDRFKDKQAAIELFRKVPFLNGGLFECLDRELSEDDIARNGSLAKFTRQEGKQRLLRVDGFSDRADNPLCIPNKVFFGEKLKSGEVDTALKKAFDTKKTGYEVDGLLTIFARYKFTVEENTPADEEVALDPELLGKVFENLLASYNDDTSTTARKKSGSFYTPREVVDFMVDEALVLHFSRYLDSDDDQKRLRTLLDMRGSGNPFDASETETLIAGIDTLRVLDPACGSGAFPMGMLQKLVHVLSRLDPGNELWKKRNLDAAARIEDPDSREDALTRLERDFSSANKVDYSRKLYLIQNCLFGADIQPIAVQIAKLRFFISLIVSQNVDETQPNWNITALPNLETKLVAADSLMPIERGEVTGDLFRNPEIDQLEKSLAAENKRYFTARSLKTKRARRAAISELRDRLAIALQSSKDLNEADAKRVAAWDPFDQNSAADFFDPEWMFGLDRLFDVVIANPPYVRQEKLGAERKAAYKKTYRAFQGMADLLVYFIERGVDLLVPGGAFSYITSNKWYRAAYGNPLRLWLNQNARISRIVDFGDADVFDALAYPTIVVASRRAGQRQEGASNEHFQVMNWADVPEGTPTEDMPSLFDTYAFPMTQKDLNPPVTSAAVKGKAKAEGWQLEPVLKRNLLARIKSAGVPLGEYVGGRFYRGILTGLNEAFVITGEKRAELIAADPKSSEIIKPFLRGRDIKRWKVESKDLWLIFTRQGVEINNYPSILQHLSTYRAALEPKPNNWVDETDGEWQGRKGGTYKWFEIQDTVAYWERFLDHKIIVPAIENGVKYAGDTLGYYSNDKTSIIVSSDWPYLLALLNSQISWWLTKLDFPSRAGGFFEFKPTIVGRLPIVRANPDSKSLVSVVSLTQLKFNDSRFEFLLNAFVYELYFPADLHARGLHLFDAARDAGLMQLEGLEGQALTTAANNFATTHLTPGAALHTKLMDLQTLDIVRIIEGKT